MNKILELQKADAENEENINKDWSTLSYSDCQNGNGGGK